jgi:acyl carrier protein
MFVLLRSAVWKRLRYAGSTILGALVTYEQFVTMVCESMGLNRDEINDDTSFLKDLGIDSLTLANFIIKLERKYSVRLDVANVWDLTTMKEAYGKFQLALESSVAKGRGN